MGCRLARCDRWPPLGGAVLICLAMTPSTGAQNASGPLTVYSSLPLSGASRPQAEAIVRGARLAVEDGAIGTYRFDPYGDTTLRSYGLYRVRRGALEWAGAVEAP